MNIFHFLYFVLIVPSGIETHFASYFINGASGVLIVPSGIETQGSRLFPGNIYQY